MLNIRVRSLGNYDSAAEDETLTKEFEQFKGKSDPQGAMKVAAHLNLLWSISEVSLHLPQKDELLSDQIEEFRSTLPTLLYCYTLCLSNRGDVLNYANAATEAANGNVSGAMELAQ